MGRRGDVERETDEAKAQCSLGDCRLAGMGRKGGNEEEECERNYRARERGMRRVDILARRVETVRTVTKLACSKIGELGMLTR